MNEGKKDGREDGIIGRKEGGINGKNLKHRKMGERRANGRTGGRISFNEERTLKNNYKSRITYRIL